VSTPANEKGLTMSEDLMRRPSHVFSTAARLSGVLLAASVALAGGVVPASAAPPTILGLSPGSGPAAGGTQVLIVGTGFEAGMTVKFGATLATILGVDSAGAVAVETPAGTVGKVAVSVTTSGGTATKVDGFEYTSGSTSPAFKLSSISPTTGSVLGGTLVTLTGTGFATGMKVAFGTTLAGNVTVVNATTITATSPASPPGAVDVSVGTETSFSTLPKAFTFAAPGATLISLSPATALAGSEGFTLTATGLGFVSGSVVLWNGVAQPTTFVSGTQLKAEIAAALLAAAGIVKVSVRPPNSAVASNELSFLIGPISLTELVPPLSPVTPVHVEVPTPVGLFTADFTGMLAGGAFTVQITPPDESTPSPGTDFEFVPNGVFELSAASAQFDAAKVCFPYTEADLATAGIDEDTLRLLHADAQKEFTDITISLDTDRNEICGSVASFSPFAIVGGDGTVAAPIVGTVTPATGPATGGTPIRVTGSNFRAGGTGVLVGGAPATDIVVRSATELTAVTPVGEPGPATLEVATAGGPAAAAGAFTYHDFRYFAEGAANATFDLQLALANPGDRDANVVVTYQTTAGDTVAEPITVPARTRRTIDPKDPAQVSGLTPAEFSMVVDSDAIVVSDRTMTWANGTHAERSVPLPAQTWYLAEGATHSNFDLFYLMQNPTATAATVTVTYLLPSASPLTKTYTVAPTSRQNIWVDFEEFPAGSGNVALASTDVSAVFESSVPIIVERAMYLSTPSTSFAAGHESGAVTAPSLQWFLAEGATGPFFDLFLLLANPGDQAAAVTVRYLLADGSVIEKAYSVRGRSRQNIWVNLEDPRLADAAVSTTLTVTNGVPIIVERSMWWPRDLTNWHEAHNSPGSTVTGTSWALAAGEDGGTDQAETYLLVANTSSWPATIEVTLLFESGPAVTRSFTVPANARFNVSVVEFPEMRGRRFGAVVSSTGAVPAAIVVERAVYGNQGGRPWGGGSNALATKIR
jgi:hypothetical protein